MLSLSWEQVCAHRLSRNYLLEPAAADQMVKMVSAVGGIQAQVMTAAELGIANRIAGVTQADVQAEIWQRRGLVRTYGPRSTLHLLPADELPMWMAAMSARMALYEAHPYEAVGFDAQQGEAILAAIGASLDGQCLTREELTAEVGKRAGTWAEQWMVSTWGSLLGQAAYAGLLCYGPSQGSRVTFARADQWVSGWHKVDPQQAIARVCRRYFATYGPATHADFGHWFWLKPAQARKVMDELGDALVEVEVEGRRAWMLAEDADSFREANIESLYLLPQYDCYILGAGQRERVVPQSTKGRILKHGRGRYEGATGLPVLLIDGVVAGMWERNKRGKRVELKVEAFAPLTPAQQERLAAEAERIGRFLGAEPVLSVGRLD